MDARKITHLIGIDPSFNTMGVCVYRPETKAMHLFTGNLLDAISWISNNAPLKSSIVILENPALDKPAFKMWGLVKTPILLFDRRKASIQDVESKFRIAMKYAQNVGESKASAKLLLELLRRKVVQVIEVSPSQRQRADKERVRHVQALRMPTKTTAKQFQELTGYTDKSSEHARDAATLVWGRSIAGVLNYLKMRAHGAKVRF